MPRPTILAKEIAAKGAHWDSTVDQNFSDIKTKTNINPLALSLVHKTTGSADSLPLSDFDPTEYFPGCYAHLVDAASPSTNGYMIYSDGSNWKYVKSNSNV